MKIQSLISIFIILSSCSIQTDKTTKTGQVTDYTSCNLPKDQGEGSFQGAWSDIPLPIIFDRDFYASDAGAVMGSLRGAVSTWNAWASLKNRQAFGILNDLSSSDGGESIPELLATCDQGAYTSAITDKIGIWKITSYGFGKNRRSSCANGKILPDGVQGQTNWITENGHITSASILLNFEYYNSPGQKKLDVESLLLHELGHVLGLLHSCSGGAEDGTSSPDCSYASAKYKEAVMFPYLETGQIRRTLQQNDYSRINCLY